MDVLNIRKECCVIWDCCICLFLKLPARSPPPACAPEVLLVSKHTKVVRNMVHTLTRVHGDAEEEDLGHIAISRARSQRVRTRTRNTGTKRRPAVTQHRNETRSPPSTAAAAPPPHDVWNRRRREPRLRVRASRCGRRRECRRRTCRTRLVKSRCSTRTPCATTSEELQPCRTEAEPIPVSANMCG